MLSLQGIKILKVLLFLNFRKEQSNIMAKNIQHNFPLKNYNSFGVAVSADQFIEITAAQQLVELFEAGAFTQPFFVLGGGSNVLFTQDYKGLILKMNSKGISYTKAADKIYVTAQAGEIWNDLVWYCVDHDFSGLENMALIPGTVGASPVQNIGAYGAELMDIFYSCIAFDTQHGCCVTFHKDDCGFTYRDSIFKSKAKGRYIILSVSYELQTNRAINSSYGAINTALAKREISKPTIQDIAQVVSHIRVEKLPDPSTIGNAGSFFKNPIIPIEQFKTLQDNYPDVIFYPIGKNHVKLAAGWLIEQCGWKGRQDGDVAVWKNQALVLTNLGNASGLAIFETSSKIMNDVNSKFNIELEREVQIL